MLAQSSADVVIVGAGAAGLAAARMLATEGKRVIVVEARNRIGGRILTQRTEAGVQSTIVPVELGAEFVHGVPPASWSLINEAHLPNTELEGKAFCFDGETLEPCGEMQRAAFGVLAGMATWMERNPSQADMTFDQYLRTAGIAPAEAERAAAYVEGFNAADRSLVSAAALVRQQRAEDQVQGERMFHIRSGYD
jgi:phytoene dehydrogenase-like protein